MSPFALEERVTKRVAVAPAQAPSFATLYRKCFPHVLRWLHIFGAPAADRDDLVQEVFLIAHRRLADFDGHNALGWLYQISRRKMRDYRRQVWVRHFGHRRDVCLMDDALSTSQGPLEELELKRQREVFVRIASRLKREQREVFVLFEFEGRGGAEIAELLGTPINTVWQWLYRARKELYARSMRTTELSQLGQDGPR